MVDLILSPQMPPTMERKLLFEVFSHNRTGVCVRACVRVFISHCDISHVYMVHEMIFLQKQTNTLHRNVVVVLE